MKKSIFIAALVVAAGLFAARPSAAQNQAKGTIEVELGATAVAEGYWDVLATQVGGPSGTTWDVKVSMNKTVTPLALQDDWLSQVSVAMFSGATGSGTLTNPYVPIGSEFNIIGTPTTTNAGWSWDDNSSEWLDPKVHVQNANDLSSTVSFSGAITVAPGTVGAIQFTLSNMGNGQETFLVSNAPEGSSLALLLPGLIPLGLILRRRRKA